MITAYLDILVFEGEKDDNWEAAYDDALKNEEYGPQHPVEGDDARGAVHAVLATFGTHQALKPCVRTTDPGAIQLKKILYISGWVGLSRPFWGKMTSTPESEMTSTDIYY